VSSGLLPNSAIIRRAIPVASALFLILAWDFFVRFLEIPSYIIPAPEAVADSLYSDWRILGRALWITAGTTIGALTLAALGGVVFAIVLAQSRMIELFAAPITVIIQVTPVVAIAPIILIYVPDPHSAQLGCAFVVTFFPIMMNTLHGLKNVDRDQADTVRLYTNSRWKMLVLLQMPSAMPSFFAGLKSGGGLALVGAVVAEFAAGSAGANSGRFDLPCHIGDRQSGSPPLVCCAGGFAVRIASAGSCVTRCTASTDIAKCHVSS
jgi:NitT/TauT family transport system permease protein